MILVETFSQPCKAPQSTGYSLFFDRVLEKMVYIPLLLYRINISLWKLLQQFDMATTSKHAISELVSLNRVQTSVVVIQLSGYLAPGTSSILVTCSQAVVSPQQTRNYIDCKLYILHHRCLKSTGVYHSVSTPSLVQSSSHFSLASDLPTLRKMPQKIPLTSLWPNSVDFFFLLSLSYVTSAAFDSLCFCNIMEVVFSDLCDNSFFPSSSQASLLPPPWPVFLLMLHSHRLLLDSLMDVP